MYYLLIAKTTAKPSEIFRRDDDVDPFEIFVSNSNGGSRKERLISPPATTSRSFSFYYDEHNREILCARKKAAEFISRGQDHYVYFEIPPNEEFITIKGPTQRASSKKYVRLDLAKEIEKIVGEEVFIDSPFAGKIYVPTDTVEPSFVQIKADSTENLDAQMYNSWFNPIILLLHLESDSITDIIDWYTRCGHVEKIVEVIPLYSKDQQFRSVLWNQIDINVERREGLSVIDYLVFDNTRTSHRYLSFMALDVLKGNFEIDYEDGYPQYKWFPFAKVDEDVTLDDFEVEMPVNKLVYGSFWSALWPQTGSGNETHNLLCELVLLFSKQKGNDFSEIEVAMKRINTLNTFQGQPVIRPGDSLYGGAEILKPEVEEDISQIKKSAIATLSLILNSKEDKQDSVLEIFIKALEELGENTPYNVQHRKYFTYDKGYGFEAPKYIDYVTQNYILPISNVFISFPKGAFPVTGSRVEVRYNESVADLKVNLARSLDNAGWEFIINLLLSKELKQDEVWLIDYREGWWSEWFTGLFDHSINCKVRFNVMDTGFTLGTTILGKGDSKLGVSQTYETPRETLRI